MTYTFQGTGEPTFKEFFNIKEKIFFEIIGLLMKYGRKYVPKYFVRGMAEYMRKNIGSFCNHLVGIEIGGAMGENALTYLSILPIKQMFLIDPCDFYTEGDYSKGGRTSDARGQFEIAKDNLKQYLDKVIFIKDYSYNCIDQFEDNSFDFVYIDGNHDYNCVKQDIELYYPKVKKGGILGGHDFGAGFYGIVRAVQELCNKYDYVLYSGRDGDWWVVKK